MILGNDRARSEFLKLSRCEQKLCPFFTIFGSSKISYTIPHNNNIKLKYSCIFKFEDAEHDGDILTFFFIKAVPIFAHQCPCPFRQKLGRKWYMGMGLAPTPPHLCSTFSLLVGAFLMNVNPNNLEITQ